MARLTREKQLHKERLLHRLSLFPFYVEEYIEDMLVRNVSPSTLLGYSHDFEQFFNWLLAEGIVQVDNIKGIPLSALEELKLKEVKSFLFYLEHELELQDETINRKISALKSLFKFLTERTEDEAGECYFYRNVMSKISMRKNVESLDSRSVAISSGILHNDKETYEFLDFMQNGYPQLFQESGKKLNFYHRDFERDYAMVALILASGIRVSELANLQLNDILWNDRTLKILRKGGKKDAVPFRLFAAEPLHTYINIRQDRYKVPDDLEYVFVTFYNGKARAMSVRAIQKAIVKYTEAFMLRMSPHKLRHSFATNYAKTNSLYELMRQLGHTSATTSALYVNASNKDQLRAINKLDLQK